MLLIHSNQTKLLTHTDRYFIYAPKKSGRAVNGVDNEGQAQKTTSHISAVVQFKLRGSIVGEMQLQSFWTLLLLLWSQGSRTNQKQKAKLHLYISLMGQRSQSVAVYKVYNDNCAPILQPCYFPINCPPTCWNMCFMIHKEKIESKQIFRSVAVGLDDENKWCLALVLGCVVGCICWCVYLLLPGSLTSQ